METLTDIFSYICGQDRCFVIDQTTLPVCQRCMGLYMGACLTGIWLLLSRGWRRGLPCLEVFLVNVGMLLTAMLGGLHIIDPGPRWRLMCGLWTGHVIVLWLIGAAWHLYILLNHGVQKRLTWTTNDKAQAFVCAALLTVVALIFVLPSLINKSRKMSSQIPFGPYIIIAAIFYVSFSNQIKSFLL